MSTKKLAKELGLLRRRSQSSHGRQKLVPSQIFSYLIVIDFESTCWREKKAHCQEIIEFPAVLLNTSTGAVESEFHTYVQPQEHPVLSDFCTELTGITQMQVEKGIPLHICLSRFTRWLQNLQLNMGVTFPSKQSPTAPSASQKLCTFLTWSDWDLGVCLQYECKRKHLHKPDELNSWVDLRSTYKMFYNKKPKGLNGALQDLGIKFEGREHSGLDDSRNTAQLATRMMRDGCVMKITSSLGRTSSTAKSTSSHAAADHKGAKCNTTRPQSPFPNVHTGGSGCQSLVSPKTLLNGTAVSRGLSTLTERALRPLPHGSVNTNSHFTLSATTCGRLARRVPVHQRTAAAAAAAQYLSLETDERRASYDDVPLKADREAPSEAAAVAPPAGHGGAPKPPPFDIFRETLLRPSCGASSRARASALTPRPVNTRSARGSPSSAPVANKSGRSVTSPLCLCGRRAKRQRVSNGGPNHGRGFYCCPVRRSVSGDRCQGPRGCQFFQWESALAAAAGSSCVSACVSLCHDRCPPQSSIRTIRKSF